MRQDLLRAHARVEVGEHVLHGARHVGADGHRRQRIDRPGGLDDRRDITLLHFRCQILGLTGPRSHHHAYGDQGAKRDHEKGYEPFVLLIVLLNRHAGRTSLVQMSAFP